MKEYQKTTSVLNIAVIDQQEVLTLYLLNLL